MGLLDRRDFCSLLVAVDDHYLNKLLFTYPTWLLCHPELLNMPQIFVYDASQVELEDERWARLHEQAEQIARLLKRPTPPEMRLIPWEMPQAESQRERMLTALVRCVDQVQTPWYLKLDADTFATEPRGFYFDKWFRRDPAFIASPWGYTKPGDSIPRIDAWAAGVPELRDCPAIDYQVINDQQGRPWKCNHRRMASWVMFGNTEWTRWASSICRDDRLPFPSQDTYLSYVAVRTGKAWLTAKFRHFGWEHCKNFHGLQAACQQTIERFGHGYHPSR